MDNLPTRNPQVFYLHKPPGGHQLVKAFSHLGKVSLEVVTQVLGIINPAPPSSLDAISL